MDRARRIAVNAALGLASVVVALGAAELAVRIAAPQQLIIIRPDIWQPVDTVGWLRRPNIDTRINTGERTVRLRTDADGFRIGSSGRIEADTRILLIGDSFMEALQVEHEQSLAGLIEAGLAAHFGRPVAVRNAGVGGWDAAHYLARGRQLLGREPYDLMIVAVYVGNDAVLTAPEVFPPRPYVDRHALRVPRSLRSHELIGAIARPINDWLKTRSHLFILLKQQFDVVRMKLGLTAEYFPSEFRKEEAESRRWGVTGEVLERLATTAEEHGTSTLFVLIPADFQVHPDAFHRHVAGFGIKPDAVDLDQPSTLLREELSSRGLDVLDALEYMRSRASSGVRLYGSVDTHLSAEGHMAIWESVGAPVVQKLKGNRPE